MSGKGSLNKVQLIGHLGSDPELRHTPSGDPVVNFNLATNHVYKDKTGSLQEKAEWHRIVVWRKLAEICKGYLKKGSHIYIEGRLSSRSWEGKDGSKKFTTEIIANSMQMLDSRPGEASSSGKFEAETEPQVAGVSREDDIPF